MHAWWKDGFVLNGEVIFALKGHPGEFLEQSGVSKVASAEAIR
jgi:hypothetical protein